MAAVNMTEGSITKHLVDYSIPLILGNMFQLTYNAVDSIIAGRFIGKEALAAEGTASPVMNIVILGISGICMGASAIAPKPRRNSCLSRPPAKPTKRSTKTIPLSERNYHG